MVGKEKNGAGYPGEPGSPSPSPVQCGQGGEEGSLCWQWGLTPGSGRSRSRTAHEQDEHPLDCPLGRALITARAHPAQHRSTQRSLPLKSGLSETTARLLLIALCKSGEGLEPGGDRRGRQQGLLREGEPGSHRRGAQRVASPWADRSPWVPQGERKSVYRRRRYLIHEKEFNLPRVLFDRDCN